MAENASPIRSNCSEGNGSMTKLSLCLICRDNERTIRPCLESIRPWVDEMVVVDTGSRDQTLRIAEELGARLFHFEWRDDFAAARNESLRHARGEWLFWMDSDDAISADSGRKLRDLAYGRHTPQTFGYVMQVECPGEREGDLTVVEHVKMFRNHPAIRFEFRVHEQVLPSIRRLGGDVQWTDISVVHYGADHTLEGRRRKYERDLRILAEELRIRSEHPFVLFNLGMTHADMEDHEAAIDYLSRCVAVSNSDESHLRKAYALLVSSLERCERTEDAQEVCRRGLSLFPGDAELLFRSAMLQHSTGKLEEAEATYLELLQDRRTEHFSSVDPGTVSYKARHNLGIVYDSMNRPDLAETQWRNATVKHVQYEPSRQAMVELLIRQRRLQAARIEIEHMLNDPRLRHDALILQGLFEEYLSDAMNR